MSCRVSLTNVAKGVVPTAFINSGPEVASSADPGYSLAALTDNVVARACRTHDAASLIQIHLDLGVATEVSFAAVFDAMGAVSGPAQVTSVDVYSSPDGTTWTLRYSLTTNSRGDGGVVFGSLTFRYWKFAFNMRNGSEKLDCGLLWLGTYTILAKTYAQIVVDPKRRTIVNETDGGGFFATKLSSYRHQVELTWAELLEPGHRDLMNVIGSADGALNSFVLLPRSGTNVSDTDADGDPAILHGRITDSFQYERTGHPSAHFKGHRMTFTESGRAA